MLVVYSHMTSRCILIGGAWLVVVECVIGAVRVITVVGAGCVIDGFVEGGRMVMVRRRIL